MIDPRRLRRLILDMAFRARVGHIGSALSVADLLAALYGEVLRAAAPDDPERDRLVLAKGHAAMALYAALHLKGWLSAEALETYCTDGTLLGVHPEQALPGVDFSTGSLGMGLPFGAGAALAARMQNSDRRVFVLLSDAECNEGSVWEAAMFAAHNRLGHLTAIVDVNGLQALGTTQAILDLSPMADRWRAFGWEPLEADGHDAAQIARALNGTASRDGQPRVLLARTVAGKGVPFMEGRVEWHYLPLNEDQYRQAIHAVEEPA